MNPIYCGPRVNIGSANVVELPQHLRLNPEAAEASRSVFGLSLAFVDPCIQVRESTRTQEQIDTVPDNNVDLPVSAGIQSDTHLAVNLEGVVETEELLSEPKPTSNETTDQDHREQSALATSDPSEEPSIESFQQTGIPVQIGNSSDAGALSPHPFTRPTSQLLWQLGNLQAQIFPQLSSGVQYDNNNIASSHEAPGVILQPAVIQDGNAISSTSVISPYGWAGTRLSHIQIGDNCSIGVQIDVKVRMINPNP